jgi:hypothetical protein
VLFQLVCDSHSTFIILVTSLKKIVSLSMKGFFQKMCLFRVLTKKSLCPVATLKLF